MDPKYDNMAIGTTCAHMTPRLFTAHVRDGAVRIGVADHSQPSHGGSLPSTHCSECVRMHHLSIAVAPADSKHEYGGWTQLPLSVDHTRRF